MMTWRCTWLLALAVTAALAAEPDNPNAAQGHKRVVPLRQAHAHNDYEHKRPLLDALEQGFCSVEADVYLVGDELLIGHTRLDLQRERTLEKLYLAPLQQRVRSNGGRVYRSGPTLYLLIDVKSEARPTFAAVDKLLAKYGDMFSVTRDGKHQTGAVSVVISGNCDRETILQQKVHYAGIDGRPGDLDSEVPAALMPWISADWRSLFRWKGEGAMPESERRKLRDYVGKAHQHGRMVRFWNTPEKVEVWQELLAAGVDLLGSDRLIELRRFLRDHSRASDK